MNNADPRVFFAAERTLLAWIRSGIALIGLGFVVAKFGLFLEMLASQARTLGHGGHAVAASPLGIAFVLLGSGVIMLAVRQHRRFVATLGPQDLPAHYTPTLAGLYATLIALAGALLALYLYAN